MLRPLLLTAFVFVSLFKLHATPPLRVGVATTEITPLAGEDTVTMMGGRQVVVDEVRDPLMAKVVVFAHGEERVALITLDLIGAGPAIFEDLPEKIAAATGITQTICALTHTHGSGRLPADIERRIATQVVETALKAVANLEPAAVGYGSTEVDEVYNRRVINRDGTVDMLWNNRDRLTTAPVDQELGVLAIRRVSDGSPIVTLVNYNAHPVISMNFERLIVSADYPGALARRIEAELGGECVFLLGAAGDINAYDADMFRYATVAETFTAVDRLGGVLADEVTAVVNRIDDFHPTLPLTYDRRTLDMGHRQDGPHPEPNIKIEINTFTIGNDFAIATIPGELFVKLGLDLKARSPAEHTWAVTCANGSFNYLPTIQATCEGGYGATSGTWLEVGAGERMIHQAIVSLHHQLGRVKPLE